jgi:RimJ/RimL family protein N-acetyltransferase
MLTPKCCISPKGPRCIPIPWNRLKRFIGASLRQPAFCFIAEVDHRPIGEGWLQEMNLAHILTRHPGKDCRRIDLLIGEKTWWGRGLGSEMIALLTEFAFLTEKADLVFGCSIADYNPRSLRAFQKSGYQIVETIQEPAGHKARFSYDVMLTQAQFVLRRQGTMSS